MICFHLITIFPEFFFSPLRTGLFKKAIEKQIIKVFLYDLRNYAYDKHKTVDDVPFGGGPGMVLKPEPIAKAIDQVKGEHPNAFVINLSPSGEKLTQSRVTELASKKDIAIICGRYEGVDERIVENMCDMEISIGDYILHTGDTSALVLLDAISRLQKGFMGCSDSILLDSFSQKGLLSFPQYTRPRVFRGWKVPEVLVSGNHRKIERWRKKESLKRTLERRPDLLKNIELNKEEKILLQEIISEKEGDLGHNKRKG